MDNSSSKPGASYTPGIPTFTGTATKTRVGLSTASKIVVSLAILGATGGFAAALAPSSGEVQPITYVTLAVRLNGSGNGDGVISSRGINCFNQFSPNTNTPASQCSARLPVGASVTLSAQIWSSLFLGWSGACSGTSTTCTVTMSATKLVTANFSGTLPPPLPPPPVQ